MSKKPNTFKPKREPPDRFEYYSQQGALVIGSLILCSITYALYESVYSGPEYAAEGAVGGAIVGFILSPFLMFGLRKKNIVVGLAVVYGPTFLIALLSGVWANRSIDGMYTAHFLPILSVIVMSIIARFVLSDDWRYPLHCCQNCGYILRGLSVEQPCPECGAERTAQVQESDHPADPAG